MIDILLIAVIVVVVIDISGFIDHLKSWIKSILTQGRMRDPNYSFKPLDCSFCMTFWSGTVYLIITNQFTLPYLAYLLGICVMTPVIRDVILFFRELFIKIIKKIS